MTVELNDVAEMKKLLLDTVMDVCTRLKHKSTWFAFNVAVGVAQENIEAAVEENFTRLHEEVRRPRTGDTVTITPQLRLWIFEQYNNFMIPPKTASAFLAANEALVVGVWASSGMYTLRAGEYTLNVPGEVL